MIDYTPALEGDLEEPGLGPTEVTPVPIPAGLWLRSGAARLSGADNLAFRAVPGDTRFTLLVGDPGDRLPTVSQVKDAVLALEAGLREHLVLTVYGAEPTEDISLAQQLADALGTSVRAHHGLILADPDGTAHRTAVDSAGQPSWRPFAQLSRYRPGGIGAVVERWRAPFTGASAVGPSRYRLTAEWTVDVVPSGLVVRPAGPTSNHLLRCAPTHPDRVDLVVDVPDGQRLPDDMLTALGRFADALPAAARSRLRVVLTPGVLPVSARALSWAVPAPQHNWFPPDDVAPAIPFSPIPFPEPEPEPEPEPDLAPVVPITPKPRLVTALAINPQGRMMLV